MNEIPDVGSSLLEQASELYQHAKDSAIDEVLKASIETAVSLIQSIVPRQLDEAHVEAVIDIEPAPLTGVTNLVITLRDNYKKATSASVRVAVREDTLFLDADDRAQYLKHWRGTMERVIEDLYAQFTKNVKAAYEHEQFNVSVRRFFGGSNTHLQESNKQLTDEWKHCQYKRLKQADDDWWRGVFGPENDGR